MNRFCAWLVHACTSRMTKASGLKFLRHLARHTLPGDAQADEVLLRVAGERAHVARG